MDKITKGDVEKGVEVYHQTFTAEWALKFSWVCSAFLADFSVGFLTHIWRFLCSMCDQLLLFARSSIRLKGPVFLSAVFCNLRIFAREMSPQLSACRTRRSALLSAGAEQPGSRGTEFEVRTNKGWRLCGDTFCSPSLFALQLKINWNSNLLFFSFS